MMSQKKKLLVGGIMMNNGKKPTDLLREEHDAVLQKLDALEEVISRLNRKDEISARLEELASFFKTDFWVHFTKEEEALFPEMESFMPRNTGPIAIMLLEHEDLRNTNDTIQQAVDIYLNDGDNATARKTLREEGSHFIEVLRDHINKENNILFMMANVHLDPAQNEKVLRLFDDIEKVRVG